MERLGQECGEREFEEREFGGSQRPARAPCAVHPCPPRESQPKVIQSHRCSTRKHAMAAAHLAKYIRHAPVGKPHVEAKVKWGAKLLGASMWFYIFYRVKNDMIEGQH